ncbi:polysaccharide export protein [Alteromonas aestuariivivens]|uniref:Polysaccharide export protein n=1 Tax=Alteromonas aestuariivivens TaxID=1938339 RepID=A0A3D8ME31_9ALTE|nr:polysaccharide biosynthesis/export family protein [Alteromonas aestuariivivens]RDV28127.1 polysaccharide export protein [Alteromonas aestuariivivens]
MTRNTLVILLLSFAGLVCAQDTESYLIGTGDRIEILVHGEDDLSFETTIGIEGTILYPFLGELMIAGRTTNEVRGIITQGLKGDYLDAPSVNVSIIEYRPFFILGEVKSPKSYSYRPGLTVDQAIAMAGGLSERASSEAIELKRTIDGEVKVFKKVSLNYLVKPGDTITVSESFF